MVYLDTSDISYLVKGRGPAGLDVPAARDRLLALLTNEQARLMISFVHLAEIAINRSTSEAALRWLETGPPIWCFTTPADSIFRAELLGQSLKINAQPLTRPMLESLRLPLCGPVRSVSAGTVARAFRWIAVGWAKAEQLRQRAARRRPNTTAKQHAEAMHEQHRIVEAILRGEHGKLPAAGRAAVSMFLPVARWVTARHGLTLEDVRAHGRLPPGCSWFAGTVPPAAWRDAGKRVKSPRDAPASALRVAIDAGRSTQPGVVYDVRHLAYAACCDFATIDGPNFRATASVRAKIVRPTFFRTASLDEVVGAIERARATR